MIPEVVVHSPGMRRDSNAWSFEDDGWKAGAECLAISFHDTGSKSRRRDPQSSWQERLPEILELSATRNLHSLLPLFHQPPRSKNRIQSSRTASRSLDPCKPHIGFGRKSPDHPTFLASPAKRTSGLAARHRHKKHLHRGFVYHLTPPTLSPPSCSRWIFDLVVVCIPLISRA